MDQEIPDIRDIVPPEAVHDPRATVILAVMVALVALAFAVALVLWLRSRQRGVSPPPLPPEPADAARAALDSLRTEAPGLQPDEVAARVRQIVDRYLHRAIGVPAKFRTAEEMTTGESPGSPPPLPELKPFAPVVQQLSRLRFSETDIGTGAGAGAGTVPADLIDAADRAIADHAASRRAGAASPPSLPKAH